ncbi:RNA polymerase sigma-54 factor [Rhodobacter sp. CZR27]|uniref:RNA polymerase factor sigma-54 n=1 Tax=Rhodobacter sp. CZR27 TaxID=2033869 RepID=UPI000BBED035|nr:RNA polymerase subunit sigma-54 [Rhodobacter sp. CZR27]
MSRLGLRLGQRQVQTVSQLAALSLLRMDAAELSAHLLAEARRNPFLRLRSPALGAPLSGTEPLAAAPGLHDHVRAEIGLRLTRPADLHLAERFIEALAPSGWLEQPVEAIAAAARVPVAHALALLEMLQQIEPAGLFARSLRECLRLQAADRGQLTPAMERVLDRLDLLAAKGPAAVAVDAGLDPAEVGCCLGAIRRMDPKPGARFDDAAHAPPLREPDLLARRSAGGWTVELNRSLLPAVRVADLPAGRPGDEVARLRREARELQRALSRRGETVLLVGAEVARRQQAFLDHGPDALQPLRLADVARPLGLHPSTVSRVVSGLLLQTPHGIVPVRLLFRSALAAGEGGGVTAAVLQQRIRALVSAEDGRRPLDDEALAAELGRAGIRVARRTVAKHRALAGILPVAQRHALPREA